MKDAPPIIVYRLGSLGDTVVALPCFHLIGKAFGGRRKIALTNVPVSGLAAPMASILGESFVDGFISYPIRMRGMEALLALRREIRSMRADTVVYLTANKGGVLAVWRDIAFFKFCGIKRVIGAPITRDLLENRQDASGDLEPEAERLARNLECLGDARLLSRESWDLNLTPTEIQAGQQAIACLQAIPFLAINLGGKVAAKNWGDTNWVSLLARIRERYPSIGLVAFGALEEADRVSNLLSSFEGPVVNLCGELNPRESASVLSGAVAFVGHDSGPLHLAASVGVRCIGLYGSYNLPRQWHPYGIGHHVLHDLRGIEKIPPETVFAAINSVLAEELP